MPRLIFMDPNILGFGHFHSPADETIISNHRASWILNRTLAMTLDKYLTAKSWSCYGRGLDGLQPAIPWDNGFPSCTESHRELKKKNTNSSARLKVNFSRFSFNGIFFRSWSHLVGGRVDELCSKFEDEDVVPEVKLDQPRQSWRPTQGLLLLSSTTSTGHSGSGPADPTDWLLHSGPTVCCQLSLRTHRQGPQHALKDAAVLYRQPKGMSVSRMLTGPGSQAVSS